MAHLPIAPAQARDAGAGVGRQFARIWRASPRAHSGIGRAGIGAGGRWSLVEPVAGFASIGGRS